VSGAHSTFLSFISFQKKAARSYERASVSPCLVVRWFPDLPGDPPPPGKVQIQRDYERNIYARAAHSLQHPRRYDYNLSIFQNHRNLDDAHLQRCAEQPPMWVRDR